MRSANPAALRCRGTIALPPRETRWRNNLARRVRLPAGRPGVSGVPLLIENGPPAPDGPLDDARGRGPAALRCRGVLAAAVLAA